MHYVGFCPVCGGGLLGVRACAGPAHLVILCDECDALWQTPEISDLPQFPEQPDLPCPECGAQLRAGRSRWATRGEIESAGWAGFLIDEEEG